MAIDFDKLDPTLAYEIGELERAVVKRTRNEIAKALDELLADDSVSVFDGKLNTVNWLKADLLRFIKKGK